MFTLENIKTTKRNVNKLQVSATDYTIEITFDQIMIETDCKSLEITQIKVNFI